jgi:GxxExxY protein
MPIHCQVPVRDLSKGEFDERDAVVMRCAYASQNHLGRLCDEQVYENDLAVRMKAEGLGEIHTQVPVVVSHEGFEKTYRLDLLADDALYELKTVAAFTGEHDAQALHYAMLLGVRHAKLLNFRTPRVQGRLRFNAIDPSQRMRVAWNVSEWRPLSDSCVRLKERIQAMVSDWGAFLDSRLYEEALVHFCGGELSCVRRVPVLRDGRQLGTQKVQCYDDGLCFFVTAMTTDVQRYATHLQRLLALTRQRGMQWMNLDRERIHLITLSPEEEP